MGRGNFPIFGRHVILNNKQLEDIVSGICWLHVTKHSCGSKQGKIFLISAKTFYIPNDEWYHIFF